MIVSIEAGTRILLFGGGGHAASVAASIRRLGGLPVAAAAPNVELDGLRVFWDDDEAMRAARAQDWLSVLALGACDTRLAVFERLVRNRCPVGTVVAATATVDAFEVGAGAVILEHAHVGARATVGSAAIVNSGAVVEHDAILGPGTHVAPGAVIGGKAMIGSGVLIGTGAVVLPEVAIGDGATVGAGAVVTRDVATASTVIGCPARPVR